MFTVLTFTDGRNDYLEQALTTFVEQVRFPERPYKILIDDMPAGRDVGALEAIALRFGFDELILNEANLGSFGNHIKAWKHLPATTEYVFHLENDFVFPAPVEVAELATVLEEPWICNITLLRQAWYKEEREAGGVFNQRPGPFREAVIRGVPVCLHQEYFGTNPGLYLYRNSVAPIFSYPLPASVPWRERYFRDRLLQTNPANQFAILGRLTDPPRVLHIGYRRVGNSPDHETPSVDDPAAERLERGIELEFEARALTSRVERLRQDIDEVLLPEIAHVQTQVRSLHRQLTQAEKPAETSHGRSEE